MRPARRVRGHGCGGSGGRPPRPPAGRWGGGGDPGRPPTLRTPLARVPLSLAAAAVGALPSRNRPLWTILAATAAWTGALAVPHLSSWGPVLLLATAAAIAAGPLP